MRLRSIFFFLFMKFELLGIVRLDYGDQIYIIITNASHIVVFPKR